MGIECSYSFWDLYKKAFTKDATEKEKEAFYKLTQAQRNNVVTRWAKKAGWETQKRKGTDGVDYIAFAPSFSNA